MAILFLQAQNSNSDTVVVKYLGELQRGSTSTFMDTILNVEQILFDIPLRKSIHRRRKSGFEFEA